MPYKIVQNKNFFKTPAHLGCPFQGEHESERWVLLMNRATI